MAASVNFYPTLDKEILHSLGSQVDFSFSYRSPEGKYTVLEVKKEGKNLTFLDTKDWNPYIDSLRIVANVSFENASALFGVDGIAPNGSSLGIALEVFSNTGKYRQVYIDDETKIMNTNGHISLDPLFVMVGKNTINRELSINVLIYLKNKAKSISREELFLNNDEGIILGKLATFTVYLSGFGSLFPVYTKALDDKKLWLLEIDYDNPDEDKLSDCVKLILNTNSKDYPYIDQNDKEHFCPKMIYEIVASVMTILIIDLKESHYLDNLDGNYADGSIMQFMKYYKETLELDIRDPVNISSTLRDYFEK